jgi:hypothetical protein
MSTYYRTLFDKMDKNTDDCELRPMDKLLRPGQNLKKLSVASGIPYDTIISYNSGGKEPSLRNALKLARGLNCSLIKIAEAFGMDVKGLPYA